MTKEEKKKIMKRHYENLKKADELMIKYFNNKVEIRAKLLKEWKDKFLPCS